IPQITSVTPSSGAAGVAIPIAITGTDFLSSSSDPTQVSTVNFTVGGVQTNITPALSAMSATQIQTTIPPTPSGCGSITVFNAASPPVPNLPGSVGSGGGTSNVVSFTIGAGVCPASVKASSSSVSSQGVMEETPAVSVDGRYVAFSAAEKEHSQV